MPDNRISDPSRTIPKSTEGPPAAQHGSPAALNASPDSTLTWADLGRRVLSAAHGVPVTIFQQAESGFGSFGASNPGREGRN